MRSLNIGHQSPSSEVLLSCQLCHCRLSIVSPLQWTLAFSENKSKCGGCHASTQKPDKARCQERMHQGEASFASPSDLQLLDMLAQPLILCLNHGRRSLRYRNTSVDHLHSFQVIHQGLAPLILRLFDLLFFEGLCCNHIVQLTCQLGHLDLLILRDYVNAPSTITDLACKALLLSVTSRFNFATSSRILMFFWVSSVRCSMQHINEQP